jgi:hypothetical protein
MYTTDYPVQGTEPIAMKTTLIPRRADPLGFATRRHAQPARTPPTRSGPPAQAAATPSRRADARLWSRSTIRLGLALSVVAIAATVVVETTRTISSAALIAGAAVVAFALSWYVDERSRHRSRERRQPR